MQVTGVQATDIPVHIVYSKASFASAVWQETWILLNTYIWLQVQDILKNN